jgi:hypothetical protein
VNPLNIPKWGAKEPKPELPVSPKRSTSFGIKKEVVLADSSSEKHVVIEVRSAQGAHPGLYKVAYRKGFTLGQYLRKLRLKRAACYSAVYDLSRKTGGRVRLSYVPNDKSHIVIGSGSLGVAGKHQRTSSDAQRLASRMGGGARVVEVKK